MKYLHLVWRNLLRKKTRTVFTVLSILVAFILFGVLAGIQFSLTFGVNVTGSDRMIVIHKVSIIQPLPESYFQKIASTDGVTDVTHMTWFGGIYQDGKNEKNFAQMAVEPESFLRLHPEFVLDDDERKEWLENRAGAIVGRVTAEQLGFEVGDRVPIQGTFFRPKSGGTTWEFIVEGIYEGAEEGTDEKNFYFHHDLLDEAALRMDGFVGWYFFSIDDPDRATEIAAAIDSRFENSRFETKTSPEKAFLQSFANQIGDIGSILRAVIAAVFFTILLVAGNTMAQSVRERVSELSVMKTVGFTDGRVLGIVLAESLLLAAAGGVPGLAIAWVVIRNTDPTGGMLPKWILSPADIAIGLGFVVALGLVAGLLPAIRAMRMSVVEGLRRA